MEPKTFSFRWVPGVSCFETPEVRPEKQVTRVAGPPGVRTFLSGGDKRGGWSAVYAGLVLYDSHMRDAALTSEQRERLDAAVRGHGLDDVQARGLEAMALLRNAEASWQADRLMVLLQAAELVDAGKLGIGEVLTALGISPATWYRRRAELRSWLDGHGGVAAEAAGDQAAAAAREVGEA